MAYLTPLRAPADSGTPATSRAPVNFTPLMIKGLLAWYAADSGVWKDLAGTVPVAVSGDVIARIDDQSGNGRNLTQNTVGLRPTWSPLTVLANRQPFFQFIGGRAMQAIFPCPEPVTIYLCGRAAVPNVGGYIFDGAVSNNSMALVIGSPTNLRQMRKNLVDPGLAIDMTIRSKGYAVIAACFKGAGSTASITGLNTSPIGNPGSTPLDAGGITIGARADMTLPATNFGWVEMIVVGAEHDVNTQNRIGSYMRDRFAL